KWKYPNCVSFIRGGVRMRYSYYFEYIGRSLVLRLPKEIHMFSEFIGLIATEDLANEVLETIDVVQQGETDEEELMINAPAVLIKPDIASVAVADILDDPPPDQYIETDEFREVVLIWKEKLPERYVDEDEEK